MQTPPQHTHNARTHARPHARTHVRTHACTHARRARMDDAPVLQAETRNLIPVLPEDRKLDTTSCMLTILWPGAALPAPHLLSPFFGQRFFSAWLNCTDTVLELIHSTARFIIWLIILIALWDPVMVVG